MPIPAKKLRLSATQMATVALFGACLALSQTFGFQAFAQAQPPAKGAPAASPAAIPDQKLKAAATAIPQVEGIRQNYENQIAQAPDGDKPRLQSQAGTEMTKAITDQGLSIPEYNSILETAEQNPEIRARLIQQLPDQDQGQDQGGPQGNPPGP